MNRGSETHNPYQSPFFLKVPLIIIPLKQIKAQPNLLSPFESINQMCLHGQWSLKGSWWMRRKKEQHGMGCPTDRSARMQCLGCGV